VAISKEKFDSIPDLVDAGSLEAWQECVLAMVDEFSLTDTQYSTIEGRYETIGKIFENPRDARLQGTTFFPQGSFLSRTVIKPPSDGEVDVDAVVWTPNTAGMKASELFEAVHKELAARVRTEQGAVPKNRCVQIVYADEAPKFHLDVTPAINATGNANKDGVGRLNVPDRKAIAAGEPGWKPSAPKDFADWVDKKSKLKVQLAMEGYDSTFVRKAEARAEPLPSKEEIDEFDPLRATIKLLKFHRERFFADRTDAEFKPISVLLTTLATKAYERIVQRSFGRRYTPIDAIIAIIEELPKGFDEMPESGTKYRLCNPVFEQENFAERWNDASGGTRRAAAFRAWHEQITRDIKLGQKAFSSKDEFAREASAAFGARGAKVALEGIIDRRVAQNETVPGLSQAVISSMTQGSALQQVFGIGSGTPKQETKPLGQLG